MHSKVEDVACRTLKIIMTFTFVMLVIVLVKFFFIFMGSTSIKKQMHA